MAETGHLHAVRQPPLHASRRTCVGCRRRDDRSALLRVVALVVEGSAAHAVAVVPDTRERLPGRGAWLHPTADCLAEADRRRAFGRALRVNAALDLSRLREWIEQQ
ncbi:YlxR family protein [Luteipulveratus mongoliensis]|uniref:YlxR domain-containing protein n=1 Tax=Luteipulveratus mongoliensis TaxID=571913 RepID=A0A0K1JID5_9MICO|nr:YlxR family protein [Luteipulveratus mongoliensis]AKU16479.1 hypothetical protein VV02_12385 [Luteipulveratus mongoliensis]